MNWQAVSLFVLTVHCSHKSKPARQFKTEAGNFHAEIKQIRIFDED